VACSTANDHYLYSGIAEFLGISCYTRTLTFNKPRLMSHVGVVRENVRANTSVFCYHDGGDASILRLTEQLQSCDCATTGVKIYETSAEVCRAK